MTDGAINSSGVSFSHGGRRKERLRGSRSTITGWAVAVAIGRARLSRLQELVGRFLKVARGLGHVFVLEPVLGGEVTLCPVAHDVEHCGPRDQPVVRFVPVDR